MAVYSEPPLHGKNIVTSMSILSAAELVIRIYLSLET